VCLVHIDGRAYVSDVGLGDGPRRPFALQEASWCEEGFSFRLEDRGSGVWRWVHDAAGSFAGFSMDVSTSVRAVHEFERFHDFYCTSPDSPFKSRGVVLQRATPEGKLIMMSCTLKLKPPSSSGETAKVLKVVTSCEEWLQAMAENFGLQLDLTPDECLTMWESVLHYHSVWSQKMIVQTPNPVQPEL